MRRVKLNFTYESKEISQDISPFILGWSFTDFSHGKADDFKIDLEDKKSLWKGSWFPDKSAKIIVGISTDNKSCTFGTFTIDEIDFSGKPSKVTLKAVSSLITKSLRREAKTRSWENVSLKQILDEISNNHGLKNFYDADSIGFTRVDQTQEPDLVFLKRLSTENGLNVKISEEKIIIFSGKKYEEKSSFAILDIHHSDIKNYNFSTKSHDIYRACQVSYWDNNQKNLLTYTYTPDVSVSTGQILNQTLKKNIRCESLAHAQKRAVHELRNKNKNETTGSLILLGDSEFMAGLNINIDGIGRLSGKYFIDEACHKQTRGSGYETVLKLRKVLGY